MHYRDLIVTAIVFGSLPYILRRPHIGILVFSWLSYMNPHRLCWGFAFDFPFALIVAVTTLVSLLFSKEPKRFPLTGFTLIWFLLLAWYTLTTVFSAFPENSWVKYERVLKIHVMTMASVMLITSKDRIHQLLWVILLSIGFYGFKGGIFTISTGGSFRVWGPPDSDIADNNHLAIALLMLCPIAYYLRSITNRIWVRRGLVILIGLMVVSAIGSQSRGALLASFAFGGYLWTKSKGKIVSAILIIVAGVLIYNFMPLSWHERMGTIKTYQQDGSAMGRIDAWKMATNLANDRVFGAGFNMWSPEMYQAYSTNPGTWNKTKAAHSIYFSVLGEHGWIGLMLWLAVLFGAWRNLGWIIQNTRDEPEFAWLNNLAKMIQVVMIVYLTGGAFLNMAYFDLPWHIIAISVIGRSLVTDAQPGKTRKLALPIQPTLSTAGVRARR